MSPKRTPHLLLLLFLVGTDPAWASADAALPDCGSNPACRSLYDQAREQSAQGNLPEALRLYRLAYQVRADPALLFSIARVLHKQGQLREAASYYVEFLSSPLDAEEQKRKAQEYLNQLGPQEPLPPQARSQGAGGLDLTTRTGTSEGRADAKPVYKRGWFWAVVVGGAAVAAGGIAAGVLLSNRQVVANGTPGTAHIHF